MKQYSSTTDTFDFNVFDREPGFYRLGTAIANEPGAVSYGVVLFIRAYNTDTGAMLVFPYNNSIMYFKSGTRGNWKTQKWVTVS